MSKPREFALTKLNFKDQCHYVVTNFFQKGFSAQEVTYKLKELNPNNAFTFNVLDVYDTLTEIYGRPGKNE